LVQLSGAGHLSGHVVLRSGSYIGAGSIVKERTEIGENSMVGAGAVVIQDVPPNTTVIGIPAKEKCKV